MPKKSALNHRLLPWMQLGEAILAVFQCNNKGCLPALFPPSRVSHTKAKQLCVAGLRSIKESLQEPVHGHFLASCLKWERSEPVEQDDMVLFLVAAICWMRLSGWNAESRINVLAIVVSCSIGRPMAEAMVRTRLAIHSMVEECFLAAKEGNVYLARQVAVSLVDGNPAMMRILMGGEEPTATNRGGSVPSKPVAKEEGDKRFLDFIRQLPVLRPAEMEQHIVASGYVAQEQARRAICIAAARHVRRLRALYVDGKKPDSLPKRDCLLLIGPSGSGKTHLLETVFGRILKLPFVIYDAGQLTESGYVGAKLEHVLGRLVQTCGGNIRMAECGVVALDEIDKIAAIGTSDGGIPGEAINRDAAGSGAQKTLLKLMEGAELSVVPYGKSSDPWTFNSRNTLVVEAGAFTALRHRRQQEEPIGFGGEASQSIKITPYEADIEAEDLIRYGMVPEFVGRLTQLVQFNNLTFAAMRDILTRNVIPCHQAELGMEGVALSVDNAVIDHLVGQALTNRAGARGLQTCLSGVMQDCLFEVLSVDNIRAVHLVLARDGVGYEMLRRPSARPTATRPETVGAAYP